MKAAIVLLSGGMDSVAALAWAIKEFGASHVRALHVHYGQTNAEHERYSAAKSCETMGIPLDVRWCPEVMGKSGILSDVKDEQQDHGAHAIVHCRNAVLLAIAASHACATVDFSSLIHIVFGGCQDDAAGFPDCRQVFVDTMAAALTAGSVRPIQIVAPWAQHSKSQILAWAKRHSVDKVVASSWSCYRASKKGPCGACHACVVRGKAFAESLMLDTSRPAITCGGDPARDK